MKKRGNSFLGEYWLKAVIAVISILLLLLLSAKLYGTFNPPEVPELDEEILLRIDEPLEFSVNEEIHTIEILEVGVDSISYQISSDTIDIEQRVGAIKKVDVDGDGYYDLQMRVIAIYPEKNAAAIGTKKIHEAYERELVSSEPAPEPTSEPVLDYRVKTEEYVIPSESGYKFEPYIPESEPEKKIESTINLSGTGSYLAPRGDRSWDTYFDVGDCTGRSFTYPQDPVKYPVPKWAQKLPYRCDKPEDKDLPITDYKYGDFSCGPFSIANAFFQLGEEIPKCEIVSERRKSIVEGTLRGIFSLFNGEAAAITFPGEVERITRKTAEQKNLKVKRFRGGEATKENILKYTTEDSVVFYRGYMDSTYLGFRQQHYFTFSPNSYKRADKFDADRRKEFVERPDKDILDIYVIYRED